MQLVSDKDHVVYGKLVRAGQEFGVPDAEGQVWLKLKLAREVEKAPPAQPRKGRYNRSDMRAEDSEAE